jgi:3-methyladenine DNA glycosylase/8-oxoguanine DNA glycosylase
VVDALVPSILEQKVNGRDAQRAYAAIVRAYGERAPGPARLMLPPSAATLASLPYHAFHRFNVERRRAETIIRAASVGPSIEALATLAPSEAARRLTSIRGVGPWTAAEVARIALGDADAVSPGDFHLPRLVAWALAREAGDVDDARMLDLLAPYAGHRARVILYLEAGGAGRARRAPRLPIHRIDQL